MAERTFSDDLRAAATFIALKGGNPDLVARLECGADAGEVEYAPVSGGADERDPIRQHAEEMRRLQAHALGKLDAPVSRESSPPEPGTRLVAIGADQVERLRRMVRAHDDPHLDFTDGHVLQSLIDAYEAHLSQTSPGGMASTGFSVGAAGTNQPAPDAPPGGEPSDPTVRVSEGRGVDLIAAERERHVAEEGWTPEHDDAEHPDGDLVRAACCYADPVIPPASACFDGKTPACWPWEPEWWKPSDDRVRNLVRAGALIAAEIDRLQRAGSPPATEEDHQQREETGDGDG